MMLWTVVLRGQVLCSSYQKIHGSINSIKLNKHTAFSEKSNYSASGVHGTGYGVDLEARMNMSWWRDVLV